MEEETDFVLSGIEDQNNGLLNNSGLFSATDSLPMMPFECEWTTHSAGVSQKSSCLVGDQLVFHCMYTHTGTPPSAALEDTGGLIGCGLLQSVCLLPKERLLTVARGQPIITKTDTVINCEWLISISRTWQEKNKVSKDK